MKVARIGFGAILALLSVVGTSSVVAFSAPSGQQWKPKIKSLEERRRLRGLKHTSETIGSIGFHHIEFYCGDAKSTASRFALALGLRVVGETGQMTGNDQCISYALQSGECRFLLTAPYSKAMASSIGDRGCSESTDEATAPFAMPSFSVDEAHSFFQKHGLAAKAIGIEVTDARQAFENSVAGGAVPVLKPTFVPTCTGQKQMSDLDIGDGCTMAEVKLYGDVVLRYISYADEKKDDSAPFLPHLNPVTGPASTRPTSGIHRIDHAVGNVPNLFEAHEYVSKFSGFHEFAEFTAEDVGTVDSGLNSVVMAGDNENVLLPLNEPTLGRRKSQIQTYLEQNEGPGLQHLALKTDDIFATIRKIREAEPLLGGFELMKRPSDAYYRELPERLGGKLTEQQYEELEELGILADADDEGTLLQIFTKPIGDRPTLFFEIIQRVGCEIEHVNGDGIIKERPGCGGFGQGNFRELFKAIEDHEKTLKV
mmetsp:Transcript_41246/g.61047  ORF Transcript_41246/g.61047 Transcript_41246/m.61047 type:complete len:482 (-) Transcript_41246:1069-2514(-)